MTNATNLTDSSGSLRAERPALASRLAAVWRTDAGPTLLWMATILVIVVIGLGALFAWLPIDTGGVDIAISSVADTLAGFVIVGGVMVGCFGAVGRRESVLGGWTRRDQVEVRAVVAATTALLAALIWTILALLQPDPQPAIQAVTGAPITTREPQFSPLGALLVAVIACSGVFVPALIVALSRIHWLAVWIGGAVLLVWAVTLVSSYGILVHPMEGLDPDAAASRNTEATVSAAIALVGAAVVVVASSIGTLRAPIKRFG
ncbi:hypothetical protein GCM10011490_28220 [Pseudoclavibacter endophyticus]|uniref:Uncharacterized protein n=1 Tax=Pseudoclavibacter endophyticus TaxID=1778590 RepID=A0A6H9WGN4_9MICO|nr:hypothetical protein [Pseudoclavibacter endophyticus]KAB1646761.1 hypothetical protein F8O04_13535 [Pseudoclavibacter endophyticus]GGA75798.1 hypothetical protein GCM10011490_28220 [Pseudoclavibacter endophyticus]